MRVRALLSGLFAALAVMLVANGVRAEVAIRITPIVLSETAPGGTAPLTATLLNIGADDFTLRELRNVAMAVSGFRRASFTVALDYAETYREDATVLANGQSQIVTLGSITVAGGAADGSYSFTLQAYYAAGAVEIGGSPQLALSVATPGGGEGGTAFAYLIDNGYLPAANQWVNVPNTNLMTWRDGCDGSFDRASTPCATGNLIVTSKTETDAIDTRIWGTQGVNCLFSACWNGAGYSPSKHQFFYFGGGHFAYNGNEIYALDLDTMTFSREVDPYPLTKANPDPHPAQGGRAIHTESGIAYAESTQELWTMGQSNSPGEVGSLVGIFDTKVAGTYGRGAYVPNIESSIGWNVGTPGYGISCYMQEDGFIYLFHMRQDLGDVDRIDPVARTVTRIRNNGLGFENQGAVTCYNGKVYFITREGDSPPITYRLRVYATATNSYSTLTSLTCNPGCSGGTMPAINYQTGMDVRPIGGAGGELWVTTSTSTLYKYDIATNAWSTITATGATQPSDPWGSPQIFNNWRYLEELDVFAMQYFDNSSNAGLWIYRPQGSTWTLANMEAHKFASECARPAVVNCVDFDDPADFTDGCSGGTIFGAGSGCPTVTEVPTRDTTIKLAGASSLRCLVNAGDSNDVCGSFTINFTPGTKSDGTSPSYPDQFGVGETFYVGFSILYSTGYVTKKVTGVGFAGDCFGPGSGACGDKLAIITAGDRPGANESSCENIEIVPADLDQRGLMQMYHSCGNNFSFRNTIPPSDFDLQPPNLCSWNTVKNNQAAYVNPPCIPQLEEVWMDIQLRVTVGSWGTASSTVQLWQRNRNDGIKRTVISKTNYTLVNDNPSNAKYGAIWLTPYNTDKDSNEQHASYEIHYDNLIISRAPIW